MFTYWQPIESREHHYYAREVAEAWRIYSLTQPYKELRFNTTLTNELLKEASLDLGSAELYYQTKTGLKRVYQREVVGEAYKRLVNDSSADGNVRVYHLNGKNYRFALGNEKALLAMQQLHPEYFEADGSRILTSDRRDERKKEIKSTLV